MNACKNQSKEANWEAAVLIQEETAVAWSMTPFQLACNHVCGFLLILHGFCSLPFPFPHNQSSSVPLVTYQSKIKLFLLYFLSR
jgi:hypothetical protein